MTRTPYLAAAMLAMSLTARAAPQSLHVALVGDSLAYGAGDEERKGIAGRLLPELRSRGVAKVATTNLAVTGSTTRDLAARLRKPETRSAIAKADVVVLSIGANDIRRYLGGSGGLGVLFGVVPDVLRSLDTIVAELRRINPKAHILILGAYAPVAHEDAALLLEPLVAVWDTTLATRYAADERVSVIRFSDIVDRPGRLSKIDSFHPSGEAYQEAARRIAATIVPAPASPGVATPVAME